MRLKVLEHRAEVKCCPGSGRTTQAKFLAGLTQLTQYGPGFKALLTYLNQKHFIPLERVNEFCEEIFHYSVGKGAILAANAQMAEVVEPVHERVKKYWIEAEETVYFDESGLRGNKQLNLVIEKIVEAAVEQGLTGLTIEQLTAFEARYAALVKQGLALYPLSEKPPGRRGKLKQSPPKNLMTV